MRALTLVAASLLAATVSAAANPGDFLYAPFDPASAALGGAADLLRAGAAAALRNPGVLGSAREREVWAAHTFLSLSRRMDAAAVAVPVGELGTLALAALQVSVSDIDGRDSNGRHTGYLSDTRDAIFFVFGLRPSPRVSVGIGLKALSRRIGEEDASGSAFDVGARVLVRDGITVALAGRNLGVMHPKGRPVGAYWPWNTSYWSDELKVQKDDRIPPAMVVSAAAVSLPWNLRAGIDIEKIEGDAAVASGGVEYPVDDRLSLSVGGTLDSPALGACVLVPVSKAILQVRYAWSTGELTGDDIHRVSLTARF